MAADLSGRIEAVEASVPSGRVTGFVQSGFEAIVETFVANFADRGDLGAATAVYVDGRIVVDLWGGIADRRTGRAWAEDTAPVIFSCSKGLLAICAYRLVDRGELDLDVPIAAYWPEFASAGKGAITVRHALSHRSGLPCLDVDLTRDEALDWATVVRAIERQRPIHSPHEGHIYHAMTFGWIVGEVIRRVTGLSPGRFFRRDLGDPLELETWIGLPDAVRSRVAWMEPPLADEDSAAAREAARLATESPIVLRSLSLGKAWGFPVEAGLVSFNDPDIQAAEVPGANGISTARSLARLYAGLVSDIDGPPLLSAPAVRDALHLRSAGPQRSGMPDDGARWGTGFQLSSPPTQPMLGTGSFGHAGAGGQLAFGDVDHRVGFAYLTNQMGGYGDVRASSLTTALRRALVG